MRISRTWAMPSRHTFTIYPIRGMITSVLSKHPGLWVDPFAGFNSPCEETNDLNPDAPTKYHMEAVEFVKQYKRIDGILFDPPYSPRQMSECYKSIGMTPTRKHTQNARLYCEVKDEATKRMRKGAIAVSFGWNSNGFGKKRGFKMIEILLVAHGAAHNDTIVTIEEKEGGEG